MTTLTLATDATDATPSSAATSTGSGPTVLTVLRWTWRVVCWLVGLAGLALVALCVLVPRATGSEPFVVLTGSMRPGIQPGDLVVDKPITDSSAVGVGTVATYQLHSGEPTTYTHRIVSQYYDGRGRLWYTFKGDANPQPDPAPVSAEQLRGTVWYVVPQAGRLSMLFDPSQREDLQRAFAVILLGYAGLTALKVALRRATTRKDDA